MRIKCVTDWLDCEPNWSRLKWILRFGRLLPSIRKQNKQTTRSLLAVTNAFLVFPTEIVGKVPQTKKKWCTARIWTFLLRRPRTKKNNSTSGMKSNNWIWAAHDDLNAQHSVFTIVQSILRAVTTHTHTHTHLPHDIFTPYTVHYFERRKLNCSCYIFERRFKRSIHYSISYLMMNQLFTWISIERRLRVRTKIR